MNRELAGRKHADRAANRPPDTGKVRLPLPQSSCTQTPSAFRFTIRKNLGAGYQAGPDEIEWRPAAGP